MIRSLADYARCFARILTDKEARRVLRARLPQPVVLDRPAIIAAVSEASAHVARAQGIGTDKGIGSYHLVDGWGASYPETTGYLIPTLLAAGTRTGSSVYIACAAEAAEWMLHIQHPDGGWQGGRVDMGRPSIVFNTAQVVRGMLAMYRHTKDERFRIAAVKAGDWMVQVQESDGAWRAHNFLGAARVYDAYVDAPLLELHALTGDDRYKQAAQRNLAWVLGRQQANGWFADCDNTIKHNDRPITHTIAYTVDGLIACGTYTGNAQWTGAAKRPAEALLSLFLRDGRLHGRYDAQWRGSEALITTGCAQLAIVWVRLHAITGDERYAEGARRMVALLIAIQRTASEGPAGARGGVPGSFPIWGRYEKFAYPNWAIKYFIDALLAVEPLVRS